MLLSSLLFLAAVVPAAQATDTSADVARWQQQEVDLAMAPIKSRADLDHHLRTVADSPLTRLPSAARQAFIDSLVFTPKGLGSYAWGPLAASLDVTETWRVLSLFGLQSTTGNVPGAAPTTMVEHHMVEATPMIQDHGNKICVVHNPNIWCAHNYGSNCSRACD
jgi:hypothetical protein